MTDKEGKKRVVVLGCGNPFAGDDGVGLEVLHALENGERLPDVDLVDAGAPGVGLLEMMLGYETAVIVDAVLNPQSEPGQVIQWEEADLPLKRGAPLSVHDVGIRDTLAFGRRSLPDQMPARIVVIGVVVTATRRWHVGLSPEVAKAVPVAAQAVRALVDKK